MYEPLNTDRCCATHSSTKFFNTNKPSKTNYYSLSRNNHVGKIILTDFSSKSYLQTATSISTYNNIDTNTFKRNKIPRPRPLINKTISETIFNNKKKGIHSLTITKSYKHFVGLGIKKPINAKKKFNPEILYTEYIARPSYSSKKKIDIPRGKSFLVEKMKKKPLNLNTFNYKNGYKYKPMLKKFGTNNNIKIRNKIIMNKQKSAWESMKCIVENTKNRNRKKKEDNMNGCFYKLLIDDERTNVKEYNDFMKDLKINLNLSKSNSKIKKLVYK